MSFLIAAAALQAAGTVFGGFAAKQKGESDLAIANYNARQMENDAVRIREVGTEKEMDHRRAVQELASRQRASFGAGGVIVDSGSAAAVQRDTHTLGEIDAMRIRRSYEDQANALDDKAELTRLSGRAKEKAGSNRFLSSILTGGAQFAASVYPTGAD